MIILKVKMSEDLNLPASLQRLEITPERSDCAKFKANNPFSVLRLDEDQPECFLENLSLKSVRPKENSHHNKKDKVDCKGLRGISKIPHWRLRSMVLGRLARSESERLLRAPMLTLPSCDASLVSRLSGSVDGKSSLLQLGTTSSNNCRCIARPQCSPSTHLMGSQNTPRFLLRAPILRVSPSSSLPLTTRWVQPSESTQQQNSQQSRPAAAMCALQARNPAPDDTSIEELASYFDLLVHIPKKMSVLAEMMYT